MKHLSIRIGGLLSFVLLFCFSCTDHEPQPETAVPPVIKTIETRLNYKPESFYIVGAELESKGSRAIKEIGIVYSLRFNNNPSFHAVPTLSDTKVVSGTNPENAGIYKTGHTLPVSSFERMYYRAFAILSDDTVVYGNVQEYVWYDTAVVEAESSVSLNGFIFAKINVTDLGNLAIAEYGVVYIYTNNLAEQLNGDPTLSDNKVVFDLPLNLGKHSKVLPIGAPARVRARSYIKYQNGLIEYGKVLAGS